MGYRSHALFAVDTDADVTIKATNPLAASMLACADRVHKREDFAIYEWDYVKWYDSHPEVKALDDWMNTQQQNDEFKFGYLRMGEERTDITEDGDWYDRDLNIGLWIDADRTPRLTDKVRGAIEVCIGHIESEWGEYAEDDLKEALEALSHLRKA